MQATGLQLMYLTVINAFIIVTTASPLGLLRKEGRRFQCPTEGGHLFADPTSCSHFIVCEHVNTIWERVHRLRCPPGLYFRPDISVCDYSSNVDCRSSYPSMMSTTTPSLFKVLSTKISTSVGSTQETDAGVVTAAAGDHTETVSTSTARSTGSSSGITSTVSPTDFTLTTTAPSTSSTDASSTIRGSGQLVNTGNSSTTVSSTTEKLS